MEDSGKTQNQHFESKPVTNISVPYLYNPHAITAILSILSVYVCGLYYYREDLGAANNAFNALKVIAVIFLLLGTLIFPTGPFTRPHPIVWNLAFGVGVIYLVFMLFLSFLAVDDARRVINFIDPSCGIDSPLKKYAENCEFTLKNLWEGTYDRFFFAHFMGWVGKSLLIRNRMICWYQSIMWEFYEYSFIFMYPNFAECWWDSVILDVFLANALGIEVGIFMCEFLEMRVYKWTNVLETKSVVGKLRRIALQFSPESWTETEWHPMSTIKRFAAVNLVAISFLIIDINSFTLKACLKIPPESDLNVVRLVLWFLIGVPAIRQCYFYLSDPKCVRFGTVSSLSVIILCVETVVSFKFSISDLPAKIPTQSYILWALYILVYVFVCAFMLRRIRKKNK